MTRFPTHNANRFGPLPLSPSGEIYRLASVGLLVFLFSISAESANAQKNETKDGSAAATAADLESFDLVWKTIHETHWDLDEDAWKTSRNELRKKAKAAKTKSEVRGAITELINSLDQSHFGLIPAESYKVLDETEKSGTDTDDDKGDNGDRGTIGIDVRLLEDVLTVTRVLPESAAAKAGVRTGWTISKIGKRSHAEIIEAAKEATEHGPVRMDTLVALMSNRATHGDLGKPARIIFKNHDGEESPAKLKYEKSNGKTVKFGHLPRLFVTHETKELEGDVVYFAFNMFFDPVNVLKAYKAAIEDARDAKGLVIDLRGNLGGIGGMTFAMASAFVDEAGELGVMKLRNQELKFPLFPQPEPYTGPVAVLIDECSVSSAEILSGGLKDLKLARLFGNQTAGLALPSTIVKLPNGDGFQYAFASYTSASGKTLEGVGVEPDERIVATRADLAEGKDPPLDHALQWILKTAK